LRLVVLRGKRVTETGGVDDPGVGTGQVAHEVHAHGLFDVVRAVGGGAFAAAQVRLGRCGGGVGHGDGPFVGDSVVPGGRRVSTSASVLRDLEAVRDLVVAAGQQNGFRVHRGRVVVVGADVVRDRACLPDVFAVDEDLCR